MYIINGKIMTMTGKNYENGVVCLREGKIAYVGEDRDAIPPLEGEEVLDVKGAWVLPGIIEAHCHMGITEEKKGMEGDDCNESVNPITPSLRAIDAINPMDAAFHEAIKAGITAAMIGPGSANVVGGQFALLKTHGRCVDEMIVKAPAALKIAFGENPKVNYSGMGKSPATRMATAAMLRKELWDAGDYLSQKEKAEKDGEDFTADFEKESYIPVLKREIPLKAHVHRVDDIFTAIRIAKEFNVKMTLDHCSEGHLIAEKLVEAGFPAIVGPELTSRNKIEVQNMSFKTPGVLQKAGMLLAITTDHPVSLIQYLPLCAGLAVKAGLDMEEGLKAITINAARICGVEERMGSIEVGKDGDLAIFTGNPMEVFTKTLYTIIDGRIIYNDKQKEENHRL